MSGPPPSSSCEPQQQNFPIEDLQFADSLDCTVGQVDKEYDGLARELFCIDRSECRGDNNELSSSREYYRMLNSFIRVVARFLAVPSAWRLASSLRIQ
nr:hypothetical protein Iba_chr12dCG10220 [Ipomoea batatas]